MPLLNLRSLSSTMTDEDVDIIETPAEARAYEIDRLQPDVTPVHPDWVPTIYYDPNKFPNDASIERIERHYANEFPGRRFNFEYLRPSALKHFAIVKYPLAEECLRRRGFVSDIEVTSFLPRDHRSATVYLTHNSAAAYHQLALIAHFLRQPATPTKTTAESLPKPRAKLARLIGQQDSVPAPLVERDGVFLPCRNFWKKEKIHFAHTWSPSLALDQGRRDPLGLCYAMPDELEMQIQFERRNSRALFNGASASSLLLWQTQALAMLRKAAWEIEFTTKPTLNKVQESKARARAKALKQFRSNAGLIRADQIDNASETALAMYQDKLYNAMLAVIEKNPHFYGPALELAEYNHGISIEQNIVAVLHGSTYVPEFDWDDIYDRQDPRHWLGPVAEWIGNLKRHRYAVLSESIAHSLVAIFSEADIDDPYDARLSEFASFIEDRFGDIVWTVIATAITDILNGSSGPVAVIYDWTRNPEEPWAAEKRKDGTIVIRGPLLDFPTSQVAYWNEKATIFTKEGGLAFRRDNRD